MQRTPPRLTSSLMLVSSLLAGCAPILSNTPVQGRPAAIQQLVGEWEGDYSSMETGRNGIITFRLRAGTDTAQGDVLMTSPRTNDANERYSTGDVVAPRTATSQLLTIRFVFAGENEVEGALDPYTDPTCGCQLLTRFYGRLNGNEIVGKYESTSAGIFHRPSSGTWKVHRLAVPANRIVLPGRPPADRQR